MTRDETQSLINEYVIHAKVKNNLILKRILDKYPNVSRFCADNGLSPSRVGEFINMRCKALIDDGWSADAMKLADALGCECEDLFTEEQATVALRSNEAYIEMSRRQALSMANPMEVLEAKDLIGKLIEKVKLTNGERSVLSLRYEKDKKLEEIGIERGISVERVRQIESSALRKLRSKVDWFT